MDSTATAPSTVPVHFSSALSAHRVILLLGAIIGLLGGTAASGLLPVTWTATTSVLVQPLDGNPYAPNAQGSDLTNLETEAQVVTSDFVARNVREALSRDDVPTPSRNGLSVAVAVNTQIVEISYKSPRNDVVEATAAQYAASYLEYRVERRNDFIRSKQASTTERINALTAELAALGKRGNDPDDPEVRSIGAQLTTLRLQLAELDTADDNPGEIIATPRATRSGVSFSWQLGALIGLILGGVTGALGALVLERRDQVLRSADDIEHLGVIVLGHHREDGAAPLDPDEEPRDVASMAAIMISRNTQPPASVAISNLSGEASVSSLSMELARVLARGRGQVVLIDAAADKPTSAPGLSEVLAGTIDIPSALAKRVRGKPIDPVRRIHIGKDPAKAAELYATSRLSEALEEAGKEFDWVILESPAAQRTTGRAVVGACHYWIPIVELGTCTRRELERGLDWAGSTGVVTLGVVAVQPSVDIFGRTQQTEWEPGEQ